MCHRIVTALTAFWLVCGQPVVQAVPEEAEPETWQKVGLLSALIDPSKEVVIAAILYEDAKWILPYLADDADSIKPTLVDLLDDVRDIVRLAAVEALAALQAKDQADSIVKRLKDPLWSVRAAAVHALVALQAKDTADAIAAYLEDPDWTVRLHAVGALGALQAKDQADAVALRLEDSTLLVRQVAVEALGALQAKDQIDAIAARLEDLDRDVRLAAIGLLVKLQAKEQAVTIAALLEDSDREVRLFAIWALGALQAKAQANAIAARLEHADRDVRMAAVQALTSLQAKDHADAIAALLEDSDQDVRQAAIEALASLQAKDQADSIVARLEHPGADVRRAAVEALGKLQANGQADAIAALLDHSDQGVRRAAVDALRVLQAKGRADFIAARLEDSDWGVRLAVLRALGALGAKDQADAIAVRLEDYVPLVRQVAVESLGALQAKDHAEAITKHLEDSDRDVRRAAVGALGALQAKNQADTIAAFLEHFYPGVREAAVEALGALQAKNQADAIAARLEDSHRDVRLAAVNALSELQARDHADAIAWRLADSDKGVRRAAVETLSELQAKDQADVIAAYLAHSESGVRHAALQALIALQAKDQADSIAALLEDSDQEVRQAAIEALTSLHAKDQANAIAARLEHADRDVRIAAVQALASLQAKKQADAIAALLEDSDQDVRVIAAQALASLQAKDKADAIVAHLEDSDRDMRLAAIQALGDLQAKDQADAIAARLEDSDLDVRRHAFACLRKLAPVDTRAIMVILEAAHERENRIGLFRFFAHYLAGENQDNQTAVAWLGEPARISAPQTMRDAVRTLRLFETWWPLTESFDDLRSELARRIGSLAQERKEQWQGELPLLKAHANNLNSAGKRQNAAAVSDAINAEKDWWEKLQAWWTDLNEWAQRALLIVAIWLALFLTGLLLLFIRPEALLRAHNLPWDKMVELKPAWLQFLATFGLTLVLIPWFAGHKRTRKAWISGFRQGRYELHELPRHFGLAYARDEDFRLAWIDRYLSGDVGFDGLTPHMRGTMLSDGEVLDAWVDRRASNARRLFDSEFFRQRRLYIPMPVWVGDAQTGTRLSDAPGPADFRRFFEQNRCVLALVGNGGAGKSALACQLARWAIDDDPENRLTTHRMITVMLSEEIDAPDSVCGRIRRRLVQSVGEAETTEEIVRALLKNQRLLVIADALSERTTATQQALVEVHAHAPVNALVATTRRPKNFGVVAVTELRPERLGVPEVVYFLTEYIKRSGASEVFSPRDTLLLGERLLAAVERGGRELRVTPLFIKLFVENALRAAGDGRGLNEVPASIPETIVAYLKGLNPSGSEIAESIPGARFLEVARSLAWLCLEGDYVPRGVRKESALARLEIELDGTGEIDRVIDALTESGIIESQEPAGVTFLNFVLDPVAEYLAAFQGMVRCGSDADAWQQWLDELKVHPNYPDGMHGFLVALENCVLTYAEQFTAPDMALSLVVAPDVPALMDAKPVAAASAAPDA